MDETLLIGRSRSRSKLSVETGRLKCTWSRGPSKCIGQVTLWGLTGSGSCDE